MKNILLKIVFVLTLCIVFQQNSFAGFPIGNGRWLLVPTYTRYTASSYWNKSGVTANSGYSNDIFVSNYFGLYGGVGIGRDVDFVFNIPYVSNRMVDLGVSDGPFSSTGDITVGLCYFLNHYDYYKHLSVTGSLIIPGYENYETKLLPGFASAGFEGKIGLAGTNTETLKDSYYDLEAGFRSYFNTGGPSQFFINATLGIPLDEDWKVNGKLNFITSSSSISDATNLNPALNREFSYLRATIGLGRRIDRNITLWGNIFKDISGRNIGQGSGFSIYAVIKF
ncbi:MAG: hypothetical protein NTZ59_03115 [Bacteroidetes bacterium]|jgi:hypothetical protein|nr:hypothetical protein [Bacteroidota bacterium]